MRELLTDIDRWHAEGKRIAVATVVQTWGSSPRRVGSKMIVTSDGQFAGSVSGGCVENAVIESARDCLESNHPELLHFGVADETAWEVGLACGGSIDVFVQPLDEDFFPSLRAAWTADSNAVNVTVIRSDSQILGREMLIQEDGSVIGSMDTPMQKKVLQLANDVLAHGKSQRLRLEDETEIFLEVISPPPTLIVVGGVHIAIALTSLAKTLGYHTIVVDPRTAWGNEQRFANIDRLIQAWIPDAFQQAGITSSTAIVMLTHDPKLDDPALTIALSSVAFYVGALGSKTTNAKRQERLRASGITEEQLARLHAPIGLDIGSETPEEIALSIMAQIVEAYRKRETYNAQNKPDVISTIESSR